MRFKHLGRKFDYIDIHECSVEYRPNKFPQIALLFPFPKSWGNQNCSCNLNSQSLNIFLNFKNSDKFYSEWYFPPSDFAKAFQSCPYSRAEECIQIYEIVSEVIPSNQLILKAKLRKRSTKRIGWCFSRPCREWRVATSDRWTADPSKSSRYAAQSGLVLPEFGTNSPDLPKKRI